MKQPSPSDLNSIQEIINAKTLARENSLSPLACKSFQSRGRSIEEPPDPVRTEFQRDRDRIVHSKSFRRLKHKTQVFIAPSGDHFVTRLTHTLEVSQIARTIARALNLNEDLTEAVALGHDIGHTPFGHAGEDEMDQLHPDGFRHADQSLRIVDLLEKDGQGLNLTWEVRQGIVSHSKPQGDFLNPALTENLTLEGQVCRVSDAVAYLNHDLADGFRAGVLTPDGLPSEITNVLGNRHAERINTMVTDIVSSSWSVTNKTSGNHDDPPSIQMSSQVRNALNAMRAFLFEEVYLAKTRAEESETARKIVRTLYAYYSDNPDGITDYLAGNDRSVVDYIAGMTDWYAMREAEKISPGISFPLSSKIT